jgi:hypothetical protein
VVLKVGDTVAVRAEVSGYSSGGPSWRVGDSTVAVVLTTETGAAVVGRRVARTDLTAFVYGAFDSSGGSASTEIIVR